MNTVRRFLYSASMPLESPFSLLLTAFDTILYPQSSPIFTPKYQNSDVANIDSWRGECSSFRCTHHPAFYFSALVAFQSTPIAAEEVKRTRVHLQKQNAKQEGASFIDAIWYIRHIKYMRTAHHIKLMNMCAQCILRLNAKYTIKRKQINLSTYISKIYI